MCYVFLLTTKTYPSLEWNWWSYNLKLCESLEGNFPTLGRVSSAAFNVWAEKEQVQYVVKVSELSEEMPGFGNLECRWGGSTCVKDEGLPCLTALQTFCAFGRAQLDPPLQKNPYSTATGHFVMDKWQLLPGMRTGVSYTVLGIC